MRETEALKEKTLAKLTNLLSTFLCTSETVTSRSSKAPYGHY